MKYILLLLLLLPLCSSLFSKEFISLNKRNLQENQIIYYNDFYTFAHLKRRLNL